MPWRRRRRSRGWRNADRGDRLLVGEHLDVGQAGRVVDADVHELPADALALAGGVGWRSALQATVAVDAVAGAAVGDAAELLDVDMQQLAGLTALVAIRWLGRLEPRELAQPDPQQDRRDGRERHRQAERDLRARHPQPAQPHDDLNELVRRAVRDRPRRRGAVQQPGLALGPVALDPLRAGALAHSGRLGGLRSRPPLLEHPSTIVSRPFGPSGALA